MSFRSITMIGLVTLSLAVSTTIVASQGYPTHPIQFVVPHPAGSQPDLLARILATHVEVTLRQRIIVENVPGANGIAAAQRVAQAMPDGYTVLITTNLTHGVNQSLVRNVPYDANASFEPVTRLGRSCFLLIANLLIPIENVQQLITHSERNQVTFASYSVVSRLGGEMLRISSPLRIVNVPFHSASEAMTNVLGGHISIMFAEISAALHHVRAGRARALAVTTSQQSAIAPGLPTLAETGVAGFDLSTWFAAFVPARTPSAVVETLRNAFLRALSDDDVRSRLLAIGIEPESSTQAELRSSVASEVLKWADVVRRAGILQQ